MSKKLCVLCCRNFSPELEAVVVAEGWSDVTVAAYPARCGRPPLTWDELRPLVDEDCTQVLLLGRTCLKGLAQTPADWPPVRQVLQAECFHLVAGATLVSEAIARGGYLITPSWVHDWRANLRALGFDEESAAEFFHEFARELILLDTGVIPDASARLAELAHAAKLPATRVAVGIDYARLLLARLVAEWRLDEARRQARMRERDHARQRADHLCAMDFLGRLALLEDEQTTIAAIEELFYMLFAPGVLHYVRYENGALQGDESLPPDIAKQFQCLENDWKWTDSGTGFILRIVRAGEPLGGIAVDRFAFPEGRARYLDLALSIAGVLALAIENARTYRRIKATEEALRMSEQRLKMAQAIGHLGHWELDVNTGDMRWSDETYRILGYEPQELAPSYDTFFQVIHSDDRARVATQIAHAREGTTFDIEYRIALPDGRKRVVHGMGAAIRLGTDKQFKVVGTIQHAAAPERAEVLGIIQDITDRKELEWKLEQEAHTDPLTGCANRRYFLEVAGHELARSRRYARELSVLMLDLDHFKAINDLHGHQVGDRTLQTLAQVCRAILREEDMMGRFGGEEFAILLLETGSEKAFEVGERLCRAVAAAEVPLDGKPPLRFTTSVGVATLANSDRRIDTLLGRADQALYEAKGAGRNRVVAAGPVPLLPDFSHQSAGS
ncbi:MAG: putative histidine kinase [Proteobacteria bacterium]|nr:putative histidine kinase [Pseudomonadota bacterium]